MVYKGNFSFLGDLDPDTGKVPAPHQELEGVSLANKVLVFNSGKGSTSGATAAWIAKRNGKAPAAMIYLESEPVLACAVITAEIPTVDHPDKNPFALIESGDYVKIDASAGVIEISRNS